MDATVDGFRHRKPLRAKFDYGNRMLHGLVRIERREFVVRVECGFDAPCEGGCRRAPDPGYGCLPAHDDARQSKLVQYRIQLRKRIGPGDPQDVAGDGVAAWNRRRNEAGF